MDKDELNFIETSAAEIWDAILEELENGVAEPSIRETSAGSSARHSLR